MTGLQPAASSPLACDAWCAVCELHTGRGDPREFYRLARLFNGLPARAKKLLQGWDSNPRMRGYEPRDLGHLSTLRFGKMAPLVGLAPRYSALQERPCGY
jgi:hypothetical protein